MKNIHLIPTDKPSRLCFRNYLFINKDNIGIYSNVEFKNIYITSDEEIKEGNWYYLPKENKVAKCPKNLKLSCVTPEWTQKIILTTDQDLIKDGVQDIDDEFLKWFVKNPSCDEIKWNAYPIGSNGNVIGTDRPYPFKGLVSNFKIQYKIIIPKEEPKYSVKKEYVDDQDAYGYDVIVKEEPKQETLEEAAERVRQESFMCCGGSKLIGYVTVGEREKVAFINGAKWQAKRSYSEEEVENIVTKTVDIFCTIFNDNDKKRIAKEWFKQFKKK